MEFSLALPVMNGTRLFLAASRGRGRGGFACFLML